MAFLFFFPHHTPACRLAKHFDVGALPPEPKLLCLLGNSFTLCVRCAGVVAPYRCAARGFVVRTLCGFCAHAARAWGEERCATLGGRCADVVAPSCCAVRCEFSLCGRCADVVRSGRGSRVRARVDGWTRALPRTKEKKQRFEYRLVAVQECTVSVQCPLCARLVGVVRALCDVVRAFGGRCA